MGAHIPAISSLPPSTCGYKKFKPDAIVDHVATCTAHSGAKKAHDWAIEQLAGLFRTTTMVKTQQMARSRGKRCGDIELTAYLADAVGPVNLVTWGVDPTLFLMAVSTIHFLLTWKKSTSF